VQKTGVFADDKVVVIAGVARGDGLYELYVDRIEYLDKSGAVVKTLAGTAPSGPAPTAVAVAKS